MSAPLPILEPTPPAGEPADVDRALESAINRLELLPGDPLTVLINDPQRHTDSPAVLDQLIARHDRRALRLLVACGTHRFSTDQRKPFEQPFKNQMGITDIAWHDATGDDLVRIGSWRGHRWLVETPAVLAIGSVEPHYFAGYTGAHKTLTIGLADREDIERHHAAALNPAARPGRLAGNPIHEATVDLLGDLAARRSVAAINLVQAGPHIVHAVGGDPLEALQDAVAPAETCFFRSIPAPADLLVLRVDGPLARSFYQADKAIKNNEWAVRDGGTLILQAHCTDGIGQDHFCRLLEQAPTHEQAIDLVEQRGYRLGDHKAVRLRYLTDPACRAVRVIVVSPGLNAEQVRLLGFQRCESLTDALDRAGPFDPAAAWNVRDAGNLVVRAEAR